MTVLAPRTSLKKIELAFLNCHRFGHAWEWLRDENIVRNTKRVPILKTEVVQCLRCTMVRYGVFDLPWEELQGNYRYDAPPGYYLELNEDGARIPRADIRVEVTRRSKRRSRAAS